MKLAASDMSGADVATTTEVATAAAAEAPEPGAAPDETFAEGEHQTRMAYGHGRMPIYVAAAWIVFFIGYVAYFWVYGWPDLVRWGAP